MPTPESDKLTDKPAHPEHTRFSLTKKGWGTITAEIKLPSGRYDVKFGLSPADGNNLSAEDGLRDLINMDYQRMDNMIVALVREAISNGLIFPPKKRRGVSSDFSRQQAWQTARYLAPPLHKWAVDVEKAKPLLYKKVLASMKKAQCSHRDPEAIVAYLIQRTFENKGKDVKWPGRSPWDNPQLFMKRANPPTDDDIPLVMKKTAKQLSPTEVCYHMTKAVSDLLQVKPPSSWRDGIPQDKIADLVSLILKGGHYLLVSPAGQVGRHHMY